MSPVAWFGAALLLLALGGVTVLFVGDARRGRVLNAFMLPAALAGGAAAFIVLVRGEPCSWSVHLGFPLGNVQWVIDPLAAFFILVILLLALPAAFYADGYLRGFAHGGSRAAHCFFLAIFPLTLLLVVTLQSSLAFLVAWELMSLISFFLLTWENEKREVFKAGINYLIAMHIGVLCLIAAFSLLPLEGGFAAFAHVLQNQPHLAHIVFPLLFIGFAVKAGFIPLHTWLPRAHPAAPSHVSALMSGVMLKMGIYGILRSLQWVGLPPVGLGYAVLVVALLTTVLGIFYAAGQDDIKKLLAYSSIENIGIMGIGIAMAMLGGAYRQPGLMVFGLAGALLHLLAHTLSKGLLFFGAGMVYRQTGERDMERLGGLIVGLPHTAAGTFCGAASICGLPPAAGFIGKFVLLLGLVRALRIPDAGLTIAAVVSLILLVLAGAVSLLVFVQFFAVVFLGHPRSEAARDVREGPAGMRLAMALPAALVVFGGLVPAVLFWPVVEPVRQLCGGGGPQELELATLAVILGRLSIVLSLLVLFFTVIFLLRLQLLGRVPLARARTWDCGYRAGNVRMQYTGSSLVRFFLMLVRPFVSISFRIQPPRGLFPGESSLHTGFADSFERGVVRPILRLSRRVNGWLAWVQSGSTQQYLLYGLLFLIAAAVWVIGGWG